MPDGVSGRASAAKRNDNSVAHSADQTPPHVVAQEAACLIDSDGTGAHHHLQVL